MQGSDHWSNCGWNSHRLEKKSSILLFIVFGWFLISLAFLIASCAYRQDVQFELRRLLIAARPLWQQLSQRLVSCLFRFCIFKRKISPSQWYVDKCSRFLHIFHRFCVSGSATKFLHKNLHRFRSREKLYAMCRRCEV